MEIIEDRMIKTVLDSVYDTPMSMLLLNYCVNCEDVQNECHLPVQIPFE